MDRPVRDGDSSAVAAGDGGGTITVLYVGHESNGTGVAAASLEGADDRMDVRTATCTDEGLERLAGEPIDCVVSDHDVPDTDGLEFLRAVRASYGDVPFVLFTSEGSEAVASEAIAAGVTDYLPNREGTGGDAVLADRVVNAVTEHRSRRVHRESAGRERRERVLASLHDATRSLMQAESEGEIAELAVRTARDILDLPITGCWLYDEDAHALVPVAATNEADRLVGDPPTYHEGEGLSWEAFETGETRVFADLSTQPERYNSETVVRSEIVLPLGEHGVLNVGSVETDAFDDGDVSLARVLASNTESALARAEREERLRAQREFVDAALDALDDVFCVFDADGHLIRWNDRVREATGYTDTELVGRPMSECLAPEDRDRIATALCDLHRTGWIRVEADLLTRDGEHVPYEFTASSLDESGDELSGFVAVGRDISERRARVRELERYESVIEASGDPVYTLDADGRFTFVNDALVEMVGHDESTLLGSRASMVMVSEEVTRTERLIRSLLSSTDDRETVEMTVVTAADERIPCEAHITILPFEEEFRGTVGVVRDVSERIEHVRKLETLQRRTQVLMHTRTETETGRVAVGTADEVLGVPLCGLHLLDDDGDVLAPIVKLDRVREAFDETPTYERTSETEVDSMVWDVFESGEPLVIEDTHGYGRLAEETPARNIVLHPLGDHGVFAVSSTEAETFDEADTVLIEILATALTAALDRVERETLLREREEQLENQNERLEAFASVVSHDLRNPLNVAMGSLDLLRVECDAERLDDVAEAHDRMETLIADLLLLAREGDDAAEIEPISLAEAAEQCWPSVETGDATFRVETDRVVLADESLLRQLLENLVQNAMEHGARRPSARDARGDTGAHDRNGDVTVTVGELGDGFYVEDDGPGIPEDERERVFEAGYSTSDDGTGFGLKIVTDAAETQGWDVAVTEGSDGGVRIEVTGVEFESQ